MDILRISETLYFKSYPPEQAISCCLRRSHSINRNAFSSIIFNSHPRSHVFFRSFDSLQYRRNISLRLNKTSCFSLVNFDILFMTSQTLLTRIFLSKYSVFPKRSHRVFNLLLETPRRLLKGEEEEEEKEQRR